MPNSIGGNQSVLTQKRIFWFWLPLATMWLMMAVEQPFISAVMTRLPDPEQNLAAFGLTFSLALFVEAPIIMLLTAGTALPKGQRSYSRLLNFTHVLAGGLTVLHLVIGLTPLYALIVGRIIGAPQEIIELSRHAFLLMTPWTSAIAYRRLWQGVLIRFGRTKVVPVTIAARLVTALTVLGIGLWIGGYPGAYVAATALSFGVIAGAGAAYAYARPTIQTYLSVPSPADGGIPWRALLSFYLPLALTSLIMLAARPLQSIGLARAAEPLLSLAVWPVVMSYLFLGTSTAISFQEAAVALLRDGRDYEHLRRFAVRLALVLSGIFVISVATPLAHLWYGRISGLSSELASFAMTPTLILAAVPGLTALISWQRGLLVHVQRTQSITQSVMVNVAVLFVTMFSLMSFTSLPGATIAASGLAASALAEWAYLVWRSRPAAATIRQVAVGAGTD
jgi:hypothetical protein